MISQIKEEPKSKSVFSFFVIYVAITCMVYILPSFKLQVPYLLAGSLMLVSFPVLMTKNPRWVTYAFFLLGATAITFFSNCLISQWGLVNAVNDAIRNIRFFLPVIWGCYAVKYCSPKQKKAILIVFLIITLFITFKTLKALEENAWIARILAQDQSTSTVEVNSYRLDNVGGYPFSYMMGPVTLLFFWSCIHTKKFWCKIITAVAVIICYYFIIQTMYTTLLLLTTIGIVMIFFFHVKNVIGKMLLVGLAIAVIFSLAEIFDYLSVFFGEDSLLSTKFANMHGSLTGGGLDSLGLRPQLMSQAIENWLKTPIFGGAYSTPSHSLLFELLQQNGVVGFCIWWSIFIMSWKMITDTLKMNDINPLLFHIVMLYFTELSIFNDTRYTFEITIIVFFITPVFCSIFCEKKG